MGGGFIMMIPCHSCESRESSVCDNNYFWIPAFGAHDGIVTVQPNTLQTYPLITPQIPHLIPDFSPRYKISCKNACVKNSEGEKQVPFSSIETCKEKDEEKAKNPEDMENNKNVAFLPPSAVNFKT